MTDVAVNSLGMGVAALSVVSSGMQQLLCGTIQRKHKLQAHQLLANTAPVQGAMLLVLGPPIDYLITGHKVTKYAWTPAAAVVMAASCSVAVLVNISQVGRVCVRVCVCLTARRQGDLGAGVAGPRALLPPPPPTKGAHDAAPSPRPSPSSCAWAGSAR